MPRRLAPLLALAALLLAACAPPPPPGALVAPERVRLQYGDAPAWADPALDDGGWTERSLFPPPDTAAVFWLRADVAPAPDAARPLGLYVSVLGAFEAYWDGVRIGASGRVGADARTERPGPIDNLFAVPDSLAGPGPHTLALRVSTFRRPAAVRNYLYGVVVGSYPAMLAASGARVRVPLFFLGAFLIVGVYYGVLWALDRRRTALLLVAVLCACLVGLLVVESWRWTTGYAYDLHLTRLLAVTGLTLAVGALLPLVFVVQFGFPRPARVFVPLAAVFAAALLVPGFDAKSYVAFWGAILAAAAVTAWAARRRMPGARLALGGVLACLAALAAFRYAFMERYIFPAFGLLTVCLLASLGLQARDERRRHDAARMQAARLEIELLKKHLLPHFLMNTLTSVMEWIETDPPTGVRFVEALADELRMLVAVADRRLIPVADELALCRAHLAVMGYRRDVRFTLTDEDVRPDARVPPALFHTLVENAVTHNAYHDADVRFHLRETRGEGRRRYTLTVPLAEDAPADHPGTGTGLRYVRTRLEESYAGRWTLHSAPADGAWRTVITLPADPPADPSWRS